MNLQKLVAIGLLLLTFTSCNNKEERHITIINLEKQIKQNFEEKPVASDTLSMLRWDSFYLLGWSADGKKIAYAIDKATGMSANFSAKIYIQDVMTGSYPWKVSVEDALIEEYDSFEGYWSVNHSYIEFVLKQHKINLAKDIQLKSFPINYNNEKLNVSLELKKHKKVSIDKDYFAGLGGYKLFLTSNARQLKLIADCELEIQEADLGYDTTSKIKVFGYFQSPDKARIAILVARLEYGFEGLKMVRYDVVGTDLKHDLAYYGE